MKKFLVYIEKSKEFAWLDSDNNLTLANIDKFGKRDAIIRFGDNEYDICVTAFKFAGKVIPCIKHTGNIALANNLVKKNCYLIGDYYLYADKKAIPTGVYWY